MKEHANAKINLCLDVVKKRQDGYHEMDMIMVPLTLHDTLEITIADHDHFVCDDDRCIMDEHNTIVKAVKLMRAQFGIRDHFHVRLTKRIPMEAGLAGGSSDAAAVMRALRKYYALPMDIVDLAKLGKQIGADVPFCVMNTSARVTGIGEIIEPFTNRCDFGILLVKPDQGVSTKEAFQRLDFQCCDHPQTALCKSALETNDFTAFCANSKNTLEYSAFQMVPQLAQIKQRLYTMGLPFVLMSGSGSTMFALSQDRNVLQACAAQLAQEFPFVSVCEML